MNPTRRNNSGKEFDYELTLSDLPDFNNSELLRLIQEEEEIQKRRGLRPGEETCTRNLSSSQQTPCVNSAPWRQIHSSQSWDKEKFNDYHETMSLAGGRNWKTSSSSLILSNTNNKSLEKLNVLECTSSARRFSSSGPASDPRKQSKSFKVLQWLTAPENIQNNLTNNVTSEIQLQQSRGRLPSRRWQAPETKEQEHQPNHTFRTSSLNMPRKSFTTHSTNGVALNGTTRGSSAGRSSSYQTVSSHNLSGTNMQRCVDARAADKRPQSPRRAQFTIRQPKAESDVYHETTKPDSHIVKAHSNHEEIKTSHNTTAPWRRSRSSQISNHRNPSEHKIAPNHTQAQSKTVFDLNLAGSQINNDASSRRVVEKQFQLAMDEKSMLYAKTNKAINATANEFINENGIFAPSSQITFVRDEKLSTPQSVSSTVMDSRNTCGSRSVTQPRTSINATYVSNLTYGYTDF